MTEPWCPEPAPEVSFRDLGATTVQPDWKPVRAGLHADEVRRLHEAGLSQPQIARELGINNATVCRTLQRLGIPARAWSDYVQLPSFEQVREMYVDKGMGIIPIAGELGCATSTVQRLLREGGVTTRRVGRPTGIPATADPKYETVVKRMRPVVSERSKGRCEARASAACGGKATVLHHRKLRSQGGTNDLANFLHVCMTCHGLIHQHVAIAYEMGWLVRSFDDPAAITVHALGSPERSPS